MHIPEQWVLIKYKSEGETRKKVFASWRGGYATSDYWKLNSGVKSTTHTKEYVDFHGHSGSTYRCYYNREGRDRMGPYNNSVLDEVLTKLKGKIINDRPDSTTLSS